MQSINKKILVTGGAGFIGFHVSLFYLKKNFEVICIDNLNDYYPTIHKIKRLKILQKYKHFSFYKLDISKKKDLKQIHEIKNIKIIIHLAAQAGVRGSDKLFNKYINSNIIGFNNILNLIKDLKIYKLIYASSSSVYGNTNKFPLKEKDFSFSPVSFYGLTKCVNENQSEQFINRNKNYSLTGLRFFTVYGEYPRPDMVMFKIFDSLYNNVNFSLYNDGENIRDLTNVKDLTKIIYGLSKKKIDKNAHQIFNIGATSPIKINRLIHLAEKFSKKKLKINSRESNNLDVFKTHSDSSKIKNYLNIKNFTPIEKGIRDFNEWFKKNND